MTRITLEEIESAHARIKDRIRRTPFLRARFLRDPPNHRGDILFKLECLQVTGSFKARGANSAATALTDVQRARGLVTASAGNHGLAVAYAARAGGTRAFVVLPERAAASRSERLRAWGAEVLIRGDVWDDANKAALELGDSEGLAYIHPFADPNVIAGQGTIALEMLKQSSHCDVFVIAVGGGGLVSGIASAVKQLKPEAKVIGIEPEGAPTLKRSLEAGKLVTLDEITTRALSLAPRRSAQINLDILKANLDDMVLVSDEEMAEAARWLWFEMGIAVELSAAAGLAAFRKGRLPLEGDENVGFLICAAGSDAFDNPTT
jgi:threonine dehydratase